MASIGTIFSTTHISLCYVSSYNNALKLLTLFAILLVEVRMQQKLHLQLKE